jgi:two-component system, chemotaxis family, chemotaxis protein CheY
MGNVMIVDDSKVIRKLIGKILEKNNFSYIEAENGIEALELLVMNDIDVIIADLNMPQMTGLELIKSIRASDCYDKIPILMLTTDTNQEAKVSCLSAGANIFMSKPMPPDLLIYEIKRLIEELK